MSEPTTIATEAVEPAKPRRVKRSADTPPSPYRYVGYHINGVISDANWVPPHVQCEEEGDHEFHTRVWPPSSRNDPTLTGRCALCGCHLVVHKEHMTGEMQGIKVVVANAEKIIVEAAE
jgi:hypothetical protein